MLALVLTTAASFAQTKGLWGTATIGTDDVSTTPTIGTFAPELTYFANRFGYGVVVNTDTRFSEYSLISAKIYYNLWQMDEKTDVKVAVAAGRYIDKPDNRGDWVYKPEISMTVPLTGTPFMWRFSGYVNIGKERCGCEFKLKNKVGVAASILIPIANTKSR